MPLEPVIRRGQKYYELVVKVVEYSGEVDPSTKQIIYTPDDIAVASYRSVSRLEAMSAYHEIRNGLGDFDEVEAGDEEEEVLTEDGYTDSDVDDLDFSE